MASVAESASTISNQLGRYFSATSLLPALLFVLWVLGLIGLGLPGEPVSMRHLTEILTTWSAAKIGGILVSSMILGLTVHPLLFATTQLLEGYWGSHPLAIRITLYRAG